MIVAPSHVAAFHLPLAHVTQRCRLGIRQNRNVDRRCQAGLDSSKVRKVIACAVPLRFHAQRRDDTDAFRQHPLQFAQHFRVQTQLQNGAALGFTRKFGVDNVVGPVAKVARCGRFQQHVCTTAPQAKR